MNLHLVEHFAYVTSIRFLVKAPFVPFSRWSFSDFPSRPCAEASNTSRTVDVLPSSFHGMRTWTRPSMIWVDIAIDLINLLLLNLYYYTCRARWVWLPACLVFNSTHISNFSLMDSRRLVFLRSKLSHDVLSKAVSLYSGLFSITRNEVHVDKGFSISYNFSCDSGTPPLPLQSVFLRPCRNLFRTLNFSNV